MKSTLAYILGSCIFILVFCSPLQAQPLQGSFESENGDFEVGSWQEKLWGGSEGAASNEVEANSSHYAFDGAFLETVTLVQEPTEGIDYYQYSTNYVGGNLLLFNTSDAPWYNSDDSSAIFIIDLEQTTVETKKFVDESNNATGEIEFKITAMGNSRDYEDYSAAIEASYAGAPSFEIADYPMVMFDSLDSASITISGPREIEVMTDIYPMSCTNWLLVSRHRMINKGILVLILGNEELDVETIDVDTITLNGVSAGPRVFYDDIKTYTENPEDYECSEKSEDGYQDLILNFSKEEVINAIGEIEDGDVITLELTGEFNDGSLDTIYGQDDVTVVIIP